MNKLHLEIITPERVVLSEDVEAVVVPAIEGEVTILPEHIPLFTRVKPGEIRFVKEKKDYFMAIQDGFLEVLNDKVNVLTDYAIRSEEVNVAKAEEAKKRAEQILANKKETENLVAVEASLRKAILDLKVARRRRHIPTS